MIKIMTISSLKLPFSFEGEFALVPLSKIDSILREEKFFKTKFYSLVIIEDGCGNIIVDDQIHQLGKARIFFINYHQVFRFTKVQNLEGVILLFTRSFYNLIYTGNTKIKDDIAFSDLPFYIDLPKKDFISFKAGLLDIKKEFTKPDLLSKEIICLSLKSAMLKYIRRTDQANYIGFKTDRKNSYIQDFKNLVELNFKELKRTSDYSEKLTISANYLNALIKEKLDVSAENYIQNRVILEAERFLLNTDLSITEISSELGFSDNSHFGKYFKKITNESPNNFRKKFQN